MLVKAGPGLSFAKGPAACVRYEPAGTFTLVPTPAAAAQKFAVAVSVKVYAPPRFELSPGSVFEFEPTNEKSKCVAPVGAINETSRSPTYVWVALNVIDADPKFPAKPLTLNKTSRGAPQVLLLEGPSGIAPVFVPVYVAAIAAPDAIINVITKSRALKAIREQKFDTVRLRREEKVCID